MRNGVDQKGLKDLAKKLGRFTPRTQKKIAGKATKQGAWIVARTARKLAPKDTGAGAKQIKPRKVKGSSFVAYGVGNEGLRQSKGYYLYFHDVGYTPGKRSGSHRKAGPNRGVEGQHFIDEAHDREADRVVPKVARQLRDEVVKELSR
jgi:hypothetical protein